MSRAQLENMDCLMCHASGYRRDLYGTHDEGWEWKPILWKNRLGLDSVSKRISLPTRTMCLRCHANSGGGPNFKRGDIEYVLRETTREYDVHMGQDGLGMECIDCHAGSDHRIRGRGTDLSGFDMPDQPLSCSDSNCHESAPHEVGILNRHTDRVYCTSCHIPEFAKTDATDMARDWSQPQYDPERDKYSAKISLENNVKPVLAWYNGNIWEQLPGSPVKMRQDGKIGIILPQGSRSDPTSKLYAFKQHKGRLPVLKEQRWLVPIVVEEFFADGDIDKAVRNAALHQYELEDIQYEWVDTVRYMGVFHGIPPADRSLGCLNCHGEKGQLDWKDLGYDEDPLKKSFMQD